jgi:tmRNA-binding protein
MKAIKNKRAFHEYEIIQKFEAGISLKGTEINPSAAGW